MNKQRAKKIVESGITCGQLKALLRNARQSGATNEKRSNVNPSLSKGVTFNVMWTALEGHPDDKRPHDLIAMNVLREFGEFGSFPSIKKQVKLPPVHHQDPIEIQ